MQRYLRGFERKPGEAGLLRGGTKVDSKSLFESSGVAAALSHDKQFIRRSRVIVNIPTWETWSSATATEPLVIAESGIARLHGWGMDFAPICAELESCFRRLARLGPKSCTRLRVRRQFHFHRSAAPSIYILFVWHTYLPTIPAQRKKLSSLSSCSLSKSHWSLLMSGLLDNSRKEPRHTRHECVERTLKKTNNTIMRIFSMEPLKTLVCVCVCVFLNFEYRNVPMRACLLFCLIEHGINASKVYTRCVGNLAHLHEGCGWWVEGRRGVCRQSASSTDDAVAKSER